MDNLKHTGQWKSRETLNYDRMLQVKDKLFRRFIGHNRHKCDGFRPTDKNSQTETA